MPENIGEFFVLVAVLELTRSQSCSVSGSLREYLTSHRTECDSCLILGLDQSLQGNFSIGERSSFALILFGPYQPATTALRSNLESHIWLSNAAWSESMLYQIAYHFHRRFPFPRDVFSSSCRSRMQSSSLVFRFKRVTGSKLNSAWTIKWDYRL